MSPIVAVLGHYYPDWRPPKDTGREWISCLCPFHGDKHPSASVSFENNAFCCFACGAKGDAARIIMNEERMSYRQALAKSEEILGGSGLMLRAEPDGKPGRRVFNDSRFDAPERPLKRLPPGVRRRPPAWS